MFPKKKNEHRKYKYIFSGKDQPYFVKKTLIKLILPKCYMKLMLAFLIDNLFGRLGCRVFQQTIGIPIGTFISRSQTSYRSF